MTFLGQLLAGPTSSLGADEERYWRTAGGSAAPTSAGVPVGPETALKLSTVYACDRLLSETVASLPALVLQYLDDGGRKRATNHPLYDVLHRQPNENNTPFEFFDFMTHSAIMRGAGYARIVPGRRGFADQLKPIHPDRVIEQPLTNGGKRYQVTNLDGSTETLNDEDVLEVRGMSSDGITRQSVITYARESLGLGLGAERHGARFFANDSTPGGVISHPTKLSKGAGERMRDQWEAAHSGANSHRVAVLEEGATWTAVGLSNRDSQFIELREFQAEDACRWFRVPPHMVGLTSKATSWGSGIEQMSLGFVIYTLMPWLQRWEQAITRDLILAPDTYFVEFLVDALLRGDLKARYDAYAIARSWGWASPNDIRRKENENPLAPQDGGDTYLRPTTHVPAATPVTLTAPAPTKAIGTHHLELVHEAAARVVRKEIAALGKAVKRGEAWPAAVAEFYGDHAVFVSQTLRMSADIAARYVAEQTAELLAKGPAVLDDLEPRRVIDLVALALETE